MSNYSIVYEEYGNPIDVLRLKDEELPKINDSQILVKLVAAPIHPSDFGKIQGSYGKLSALPAVGGREGLGEVIEVGSSVRGLNVGATVKMPETLGTWREFTILEQKDVIKVPSSIKPELAAMSFINPPTAWRLLTDFVPLRPGDWVIQNAATSAVGHAVIQLAKYWGYKTINVVRDIAVANELKKLGANVVITTDSIPNLKDFTDGDAPKLALNSIGGESALAILKSLDLNGTMVTFGGMTSEKVRFPTRELIFKNIQLRGFWMDNWVKTHSKLEYSDCLKQIWALMQAGRLTQPVAGTYSLQNWADALKHASTTSKNGKILFVNSNFS